MDIVSLSHIFNLDTILDTVRERTGEVVSDDGILEPLRQILNELSTGSALLSDRGALAMQEEITSKLVLRVKVDQLIAAHPEISDEQIRAPVWVTGLPRTGSTKLQRVLAASGAFQYLPLWKLNIPLPLADADPQAEDPRIALAVTMQEQIREAFPRAFAGHPMVATEPDEESLLMVPNSQVMCWWARLPAYSEWMKGKHFEPVYTWLKKILQVEQWLDEKGTEKRPFILKAPAHLRAIDDIVKVFPDAVIVFCHRDPLEIVASAAALNEGLWQFYSDQPGGHESGRFVLESLSYELSCWLSVRDQVNRTNPVIDAKYTTILSKADVVVEKIFDRIGKKFGATEKALIAQWQANNPRHKHGGFDYSLKQYGLRNDEVEDAFRNYINLGLY